MATSSFNFRPSKRSFEVRAGRKSAEPSPLADDYTRALETGEIYEITVSETVAEELVKELKRAARLYVEVIDNLRRPGRIKIQILDAGNGKITVLWQALPPVAYNPLKADGTPRKSRSKTETAA